ncbi:SPOR domain-containing protein [Sphingomonas sp. NPDC079357]|uniref:SPOR domain-containing protein n=1 Tax=Sphingomonas sp. NPDC079357 TaxID=3364518 RepID=UPI00384D0982
MREGEPIGRMSDADRLPWLDTVEADDPYAVPVGRIVALVAVGLLVLGAILFGLYRWQFAGSGGDGRLIAAPAGDYKIRPDEPGGMKVIGEGDSAIAASAGNHTDAAIDLAQVPEAPVARATAPAPGAGTPANGAPTASVAVPQAAAPLRAQRPVSAPATQVSGTSSGGTMVQLGAFPSQAVANGAWSQIARRFGYVATLEKVVQPALVKGKTVYRLRVNAGSGAAAADLCARLKLAGEGCFVTG